MGERNRDALAVRLLLECDVVGGNLADMEDVVTESVRPNGLHIHSGLISGGLKLRAHTRHRWFIRVLHSEAQGLDRGLNPNERLRAQVARVPTAETFADLVIDHALLGAVAANPELRGPVVLSDSVGAARR